MSEKQPSDEELREALEEQMRRIRVEDVLAQTTVTLINLAARRLGLAGAPEEAGEPDAEQARLAIEGARALMPLMPEEVQKQLREPLTQLQMAFAQAAQQGGTPEQPEETGDRRQETGEAASGDAGEAERAKARSKIWTPPGT